MSTQNPIKPIILMHHAIAVAIYCTLCLLLLFPIVSAGETDLSLPRADGLLMYEAAYAFDTIPDVLTSESEYPATISFFNKGLAQWRENTKEKFGLLYQGGQSSVQIDPLFNPISEGIFVSNGEEARFSFLIQTPKKPGTYSLSFTMAVLKAGRYEPFEQTFTRTIKIVPKSGISSAQFGAISVLSAPPLAEIYVGGEYVGRTPFIIPDLTPATYRVRVADGTYGSKEVAVQVARSSMTEVIFDLIDNEKTSIKTGKIFEFTYLGRLTSLAPSLEAMVGIILFLFFLAVLWILKRETILKHHVTASFLAAIHDGVMSIMKAGNRESSSHTSYSTPNADTPPKDEEEFGEDELKAVNMKDDVPHMLEEEPSNTITHMQGSKESELRSALAGNNTKLERTEDTATIAGIIDKAHTTSSGKAPQAIPDLFAAEILRGQNNQGTKRSVFLGAYNTPQYDHISNEKKASTSKELFTSRNQIFEKSPSHAYVHPEELSGMPFQISIGESVFPSQLQDRYEPLCVLGEDAYARTFKVKKRADGEIRALKISHDTQPVSEILLTETNIWRNMQHANIVKMYASDFSHDLKVIELEYQIGFMYKGKHYISLQDIPKPIREKYALSIVVDIAKGLDYAHTLGIRHYHISLGNIMISSHFRAKLSGFARGKNEFGPAFYYSTIHPDASAEDIAYLAPEQREPNAGALGTQTDMYQLGVIFYELLTGYTPYSLPLYKQVYGKEENEADKEELYEKNNEFIPPSLIFPAFSRYDDIFTKLLAYDKKKRYSSARKLLAELEKNSS